jgi:N-acetylglucosaminyldiphosphoundecaprenol N-acetyl-beta-D-mannosaminyltransferase
VAALREAVAERRPTAVHLCNAYTLTLSSRDASYARSLDGALNLVDGTPVTWYYRLLTGNPARGPVRGPSFMRRVLDEPGLRHYLYGGTERVLANLEAAIALHHPAAAVVGRHAPPFSSLDDHDVASLVADLEATHASVVWVGLGTPKQDLLLAALAESTDVVGVGVGAAFDFLSGEKKEAPAVLHGTGLEWLHRLATEPRRLWRRYLLGNVAFLRLATHELRAQRRLRRLHSSA